MKAFHIFTEEEHNELSLALSNVAAISPYVNYSKFKETMIRNVQDNVIPEFFVKLCERIREDRENGKLVHVLKNCPVDTNLPELNHDDPINDKYRLKKTFLGEAFLGTFAYFLGNPLLTYASRNNGDFFTDVVSINRFRGKNTGFTDGDLIYHNDRTSHPVRADFVTLLGARCPKNDLVYTAYIDGKDIVSHLSPEQIQTLREEWFYTEVDDLTREKDKKWDKSTAHAILKDGTICFQDTLTKPIPDAPREAVEALLAFKDGMTKSPKERHRLEDGDLLVFANQAGLHNRERIEVNNAEDTSKRWLLKTYSFKDSTVADKYTDYWKDGIYGCAMDRLEDKSLSK
ncbi:TauD/TfdA family dioxygenase [Bacillus cereus]|nr:TauD/TfdA family dioxygenase [Bacillus cereus]MEB9822074.1 TauD/TfdA family dioxygenase [Bacillus cereus]MEB9828489.1 TauD/TfdA family dioxygenase [Bacillus cereus]PES03467.1 taurine catabolism dioxygenase TauD [Bacillus cereus]PFF74037.1 taurine catabolism dioxygenase TauD [Bacillus cereus]